MKHPFKPISGLYEEFSIYNVNLWFESPSPLKIKDLDEETLRTTSWYARAWAEALLFSKIIGLETPELTDEWKGLRPFGDGTPSLDEFWSCTEIEIACACFPTICDDKDKTYVWRIYVVNKSPFAEGQDHRGHLTDTACIGRHQSVFLSCNFHEIKDKIKSNSWQLAFAMAEMATRNLNKRKDLACKWLLTGKVSDNAVEKVTIDAKDNLFNQTKRNILIPEGNKDDLQASQDKREIHFVSSMEQAWRIISGEGFDKAIDIKIPEDPELHILVGGALDPVFSVIFLLNPSKVFLWHSSETKENAELIEKTLERIPEFKASIKLCSMDSHDLSDAYQQFDAYFKDRKPNRVISNTGGNRLMGTAALLVAQTYNIQVVYRDIDAKDDTLTVIQFDEDLPESGDIPLNRCSFNNHIKWEKLYSKSQKRKETRTVEEILQSLYKDF